MGNHQDVSISEYAAANLPTVYGELKVVVFFDESGNEENLALIKGEIGDGEDIVVRLHSECLTSEVLGSLKCDCREQLQHALKYICEHEKGVLIYLRQEGRGIGLGNKIRAYALQEEGFDTVEANRILGFPDDLRSYDVAAAMLKNLGICSVRLLTNNPLKISGLRERGIAVNARIPLQMKSHSLNQHYLRTKAQKSGHLIDLDDDINQFEPAGKIKGL